MKKSLKKAIQEYRNSRLPVSFNFKMTCKDLFKKKKIIFERKNHYIHQYPGRIFPYIPLYFLSIDDFSSHKGLVLDPFSGSGTVLIESITNPIIKRNALGCEINPLARLLSNVKISGNDSFDTDVYLKDIESFYYSRRDTSEFIPKYKNIDLWFSKEVQEKLSKLKYAISKIDISSNLKDFFWISFSGIIRKISKADPYIPPPVILKLKKYKNSKEKYQRLKKFIEVGDDPDVLNLFKKNVRFNYKKIKYIISIKGEKINNVSARIIWDDARKIKRGEMLECGRIKRCYKRKLKSKTIDIILTSPPYLTAQKYIRTSKLELLWLGYTRDEINELEKSSIGTENVSIKGEVEKLGVGSIDKIITNTSLESKKRSLMVYEYFMNMKSTFIEMMRLLKGNGYAIIVLGDNKVLGKRIYTYKLIKDLAREVGFKEVVILRDTIRSHGMMTSRNGTGGLIKNEFILVLKKV